jgi:NADP-dependent 3-hydroxy acid dehydrogenase YdfG
MVCDITKSKECEKVKEDLSEEFQNVDVLINNAGLALGFKKTWEYDDDEVEVKIKK